MSYARCHNPGCPGGRERVWAAWEDERLGWAWCSDRCRADEEPVVAAAHAELRGR